MLRWATLGLAAGAASAGAQGLFIDRDGGRHPWRTTADHVLLWDGEPYLPFGGMYCARAFWQDGDTPLQQDRELLQTIRDAGIEDLYLNPVREVPPSRLQQVIELLEELGFRYGLQICTPPESRIEGYGVGPDRFLARAEQPGRVTFPAEGLASARYVSVSAEAGALLGAGSVDAREGVFAVEAPEAPPGGALVKLIPRASAAWIAPEDGARTAEYLRQLRLGPGFRMLVDPIGNEYSPPRFFLPAAEAWREEFAQFLGARYRRPAELAEAWGLDPALPWSPERAARLVPLIGGPAGSGWADRGHVVDDGTEEVFTVDLRRSRMWWDVCEAREASLRTRLNDLCDTLKAVCDVPVVAKRHHESTSVWTSGREAGGLDGLGMESYVGGDRLATFNGAATYAEVVGTKQSARPLAATAPGH